MTDEKRFFLIHSPAGRLGSSGRLASASDSARARTVRGPPPRCPISGHQRSTILRRTLKKLTTTLIVNEQAR